MNTKHNSICRAMLQTRPIKITHTHTHAYTENSYTYNGENFKAKIYKWYTCIRYIHTHWHTYTHIYTCTVHTNAAHIDGARPSELKNEPKLKNKLVNFSIIDKSHRNIHLYLPSTKRSFFLILLLLSIHLAQNECYKWDDRAECNIAKIIEKLKGELKEDEQQTKRTHHHNQNKNSNNSNWFDGLSYTKWQCCCCCCCCCFWWTMQCLEFRFSNKKKETTHN